MVKDELISDFYIKKTCLKIGIPDNQHRELKG